MVNPPGPIVEIWGLSLEYARKSAPGKALIAFRDLQLDLAEGERVAVVGPSGSGKSALLRTLAGQERPSSGRARVVGRDLAALRKRDLPRFRQEVSHVSQRPEATLLPSLNVAENVEAAVMAGPWAMKGGRALVRDLLAAFSLAGQANRAPAELRAGERHRLALAVALGTWPRLLLADDPQRGLAPDESAELAACLSDVLARSGTSMIVTAPDRQSVPAIDRVLDLPAPPALAALAPVRRPAVEPGGEDPAVLNVHGSHPRSGSPEWALHVREGELVALVGGSARERTEVLAMCGGHSGTGVAPVVVAGQVARRTAWVAAAGTPGQGTVEEQVLLSARLAGASRRESAKVTGMVLEATRLADHSATPACRLALWEERCLSLAAALAGVPALLIADEPEGGLDAASAALVRGVLREVADSGVAVLVATGERGMGEVADRVLLIAEGGGREAPAVA